MASSSSPTKKGDGAAYESPAEGNVYASKTELLEWFNGLLQLQLSRLEQFASGAVFCQLLDAYFKDAIPMSKINYHASNEYDALTNYKVLQQGFTAINLTRDIHVSKLSRGSRVELLELLQYLYKYLLKLKAQEGYNASERRAITVKGAIDTVPLPSWMSGSQAAGRGGMNRSSGNWGLAVEPQQSVRLRASGSFNPAATHAPGKAGGAAAGGTAGSPDKSERTTGGQRRPCAPARVPSASPNRDTQVAAAAAAAGAGAAAAAAAAAATAATAAAAAAFKHAEETPDKDDESGATVFRVLQKEEEEVSSTRAAPDDPDSTTRLIIPGNIICSSMLRPLSPGSRSQLEVCLGAAAEAISVLGKTCSNMWQICSTLPGCSDSFAYRGKIESLRDAANTTAGHVVLLLSDVAALCCRKTGDSVRAMSAQTQKLQQDMAEVEGQLAASTQELLAATAARPLSGQQLLNLQLTQLQKQLASTAALDGCLRAIGTAYAALTSLSHKEGLAVATRFVMDGSSAAAAAPGAVSAAAVGANGVVGVTSNVLKLGDCSLKRLRNGDIYKGRYQGSRKNGEGTYCFMNQDVYEGEFRDDRMAGSGVYSFAPEGRYEGDWAAAVYEGCGSETFSKGSTYHGQYAGGLRHGWGSCRFFSGDFYCGQWCKGLRDGCGMQQCTDDSNYVGDYRRGKRHGYGVYSFPNGDEYLGEYEDDIPQGYGVYVFGSGQKYEGHWDKGKKHGWSIYTVLWQQRGHDNFPNTVETGQRWAGSWVEGKPQWVHPLPQDGSDPAAEATPEVADNLNHALAASKNAQEGGRLAQAKLHSHWDAAGEVQQGLAAAVAKSDKATQAAQAARRQAQLLAARLDAAAILVEDGSKSARMQLAG